MILINVKHYLSDQGIARFSEWFKQATKILSRQNGFVSICYAQDPNDKQCMQIWIEFKEKDHLNKWMAAKDHADLNKSLDEFRTKPYLATQFEVLAAASAETCA